ncbi:hypothetical protein F8388_001287 [Cannabis sativa]|uniref:Uncharacterized protein n=1 Tax=Cannabis sativa TaxID=3483 RepID=A0A7J6G6M4_CANSA|nr:hypothetical protein F8388_001287 [Cannabis sativa]
MRYSRNFVVDLLRKWMNKSEYVPLGGIAYYVSAPSSSEDMAANPFHSLFFVVFMLSACALFSKYVAALPPSTSSPRRCCQEASLRVPFLHTTSFVLGFRPFGPFDHSFKNVLKSKNTILKACPFGVRFLFLKSEASLSLYTPLKKTSNPLY